MAQISFSFSGGFWPISFPLFHGIARPSALETVLVSAYMNGSFVVEKEPYLDRGSRALVDPDQTVGLLRSGRSTNQVDGKVRRSVKAASGMPRGSPTGWVGANETELDELRE